MLAVEQMGGKLGGLPAEVIVVDDEQKPDVAANKAQELVERDEVDFVVGPIFSNILIAIAKPVTDAGTILIIAERRHLELRRGRVQPELLRHLLPERPEPRGAGQVCAGARATRTSS